ncbi:integral membrane protein [Paracoccidioides lutzii Pb01]|uniref:Integral membrane protein n=1 Tax=Paracoccidioides lutzii (strain ATCC MYA-826 / Pb01) TaxID=502779 RepID=C1H026_PARBA|nr:integral membrane protein [Paracoccidioides lutzii Pb01]EEH33067.2 integral membrane protein [Paracoccidioides lutzii Pb01]
MAIGKNTTTSMIGLSLLSAPGPSSLQKPRETIEERGRAISQATNDLPGSLFSSEDGSQPAMMPTDLNVSKPEAVAVIITLAGVSFLNTMGSGILIAALPRIAKDVGIPQALILWPAAVYALAAECLLLIFGAIADVVGAKLMWVVGSFLFVIFTVAIGVAKTGIQIIIFLTFAGAAISMCLPTAVSLITNTFPKGFWRNFAFVMNGMGQPLGYVVGLVLGGIFTDTIDWRWAYYMMALINICLSLVSIWSLPSIKNNSDARKPWTRRLLEDIDWLGAVIISSALGVLLYVLAMTTSSYYRIGDPQDIALLIVSCVLLAAFPCWMHYQVKRGKPALIPNRLWKRASFTSICASVFFCWASMNGIEYFITLYFQQVEGLSALQSSLRFLAHVIMGVSANIATAFFTSRVKVRTLAVVSALATMIAPILMATVEVKENYWFRPFWALFLSPVNPDVAQFGTSVVLAVTASIAASVTEHSGILEYRAALMEGYRASFWTIFIATAFVVVVSFFGLKEGGTVGKKEE